MTRPFHVIIPTQYGLHARTCFERLELLPRPNHVHIVHDACGWPQAVNKGLQFAASLSGKNVIIMDDDIELQPESFLHLDKALEQADIVGFRLAFPDGRVQHAGGVFVESPTVPGTYDLTHRLDGLLDYPVYMPHVTTSLVVIKGEVFDAIGNFETTWPGKQFEDADFMFRALEAGFKIIYWPSVAVHHESATKRDPAAPDSFFAEVKVNYRLLKQRWIDKPGFIDMCVEKCPGCIAELIVEKE